MRNKPFQKKLTPQEEQELRTKLMETPLEKNDYLAMVMAGLIVILPVVVLILGVVMLLLLALFVW